MNAQFSDDGRAEAPSPLPYTINPVLSRLNEVAALHEEMVARCNTQTHELQLAHARLAAMETDKQQLMAEIAALRGQLASAQQRARRSEETNRQLAAQLNEIHRAVLRQPNNLYHLILKACLIITGSARGLYLVLRDNQPPQVRASIGLDGQAERLSPYLEALCEKVQAEQRVLACNDPVLDGLPARTEQDGAFRNCLVTPVVLLNNLDGIILVADKSEGDYDEEDKETLLSVGHEAAIAMENVRLQEEIRRAYLSIVSLLADAVEAKDPYTHGHCTMVAHYARLIAEHLELTDDEKRIVYYAALLHDVGKIGVSDSILNKPGKLLPEELELVRAHVRIGHDLIANVDALAEVANVVLHHHERYDGNGYPAGLKGQEIPLAARIVTVVDSFSAMMTQRSYKARYDMERARQELEWNAGSQFDPQIVETFLTLLQSTEYFEGEAQDAHALPGIASLEER